MGLDMYLAANITVAEDSEVGRVIEKFLSDTHRKQMEDPSWGHEAYVSGWSFGGGPEELYLALVAALRVTPNGGSPRFEVAKAEEGYRVSPIVGYWRKANQIHNWFVNEVQGGVDECQTSEVHVEQLGDLYERCQTVLEARDSKSFMECREVCLKLLPPTSGFFFGPTEFDEWYFENIESTVRILDEIKRTPALRGATFTYQSSW